MKKRTLCVFLSLVVFLNMFSTCVFALGTTVSLETPTSSENSEIKWKQKFGSSYLDAPSAVTVAGEYIIIMSKTTLLKIDRKTGDTVAKATMVTDPGFTYVPVCCHDGVAYCPLDNATIQAFDIATMKSLWVYHDPLGGQSLTPIVAESGKIYTGFWNDEDKKANFVCLSTTDDDPKNSFEEKSSDWTYAYLGGFYRTKCKIIGDYLYVGTDDGTIYSDRTSKVLSLNKKTGKLVDYIDTLGDIRSGIAEDNGSLFFVSKAGYLYKVAHNNGSFDKSSLKRLALGGSSTSTPLIYNGKVYIGVQGSSASSGYIKAINENDLTVSYSVQTAGYPQSDFLLSNYYEKDKGKIYVYFTCNYIPGGMSVLVEDKNQSCGEVYSIYSPDSSESGYCISPVVADDDATLFFKNDSGCIFAITKKKQVPERKSLFRRIIEWIVSIFRKIKGLFTR